MINTGLGEVPDADNVAPFEFIPWILSRCADVDEAKTLISRMNPVGVMTNNPTFDQQMFHLSNYMHLSNKPVTNTFAKGLEITEYSRGMGAMGMPGDLSSASRFVKAAFTCMNSVSGNSEEESVSQFFHILGSVEQQRGNRRRSIDSVSDDQRTADTISKLKSRYFSVRILKRIFNYISLLFGCPNLP